MGLSLFDYVEPEQFIERNAATKRKKMEDGELENEIWNYRVSNYNLFCECNGDYVKEEQALEFLKKHGFDFDVHSRQAIQYVRGNDVDPNDKYEDISLRSLFAKMLRLKKPLIVHNGLLDIMYLYHHFYCELPSNANTWILDMNEMYRGGLYDTKYICELNTDLKISFLEYLFYYTQRMNLLKIAYDDDHTTMSFPQLQDDQIEARFYDFGNLKTQILKEKPTDVELCKSYGNYGWCKERDDCPKSHSIDWILDAKFDNSKAKNRYTKDLMRMKQLNGGDLNGQAGEEDIIRFSEKGGVHSAGYDAFMTSFTFAYFVSEYFEDMPVRLDSMNIKRKLRYVLNRIFLPFTNKHTLHIKRSEYSSPSRNHRLKCDKIFPYVGAQGETNEDDEPKEAAASGGQTGGNQPNNRSKQNRNKRPNSIRYNQNRFNQQNGCENLN